MLWTARDWHDQKYVLVLLEDTPSIVHPSSEILLLWFLWHPRTSEAVLCVVGTWHTGRCVRSGRSLQLLVPEPCVSYAAVG